ncbi:unnamed protein product [Oppiella nova]|uniref:Alpha-2-macroglobulin domain-containing protein n=1 Tax=Oppiella nova TaxID=334625 RepID=A0A7R9QWY2_9ACAR|nr:unnamed protein product [Oppiella nova]CAG2178654.1 unnamed protein product [Oppiella nova]
MAVHRMAPKARILCYYVREDNEEVVADAMDFEVDGLFRTDVSIDTDLKEAEPGAQVAVRVNTKPDAWVGIVGVDQSVLLVKSGNDMTREAVIQELQTFDTTFTTQWDGYTSTAQKLFNFSGVVVISNGLVYKHDKDYVLKSRSLLPKFNELRMMAVEIVSKVESKSAQLDRIPQPRIPRPHPQSNGCAVIKSTIPDTITSWFISAFAMHMETGLGIAPTPTKVTVFRPFFIKLSLPYSIIRGETVAIEAIVFNYTTKSIESEVVFDNKKQEFEFSDQLDIKGVNVSEMRQLVSIPANDGVSVTFTITPKTMGYIDIKLTATSAMAGDSVLKKLLVKPEGQTQHFNQSVLVDLKESANVLTKNVSIVIPKIAVPGSQKVWVTAIGDIMGPIVYNLDMGYIDIKLTANSAMAGDSVLKKLLVKPEGQTQHFNQSVLVDLKELSNVLTKNVSIVIPKIAVPGSQKVWVTAIGDIMGPIVHNLDDLLQMPYGCGEQNMM